MPDSGWLRRGRSDVADSLVAGPVTAAIEQVDEGRLVEVVVGFEAALV